MVESYIPTDVKLTVEKPVKPKLSSEELVTVEIPGKPVPAENFEFEESKSSSKKRRVFGKAKISATKIAKDTILIITEKPQAAQKIASAIGPASKYSEDGVPYYEISRDDEKIIVCSAVGHLFTLTYKQGQKGWPIYDIEWIPSYTKKNSAFTRKYFNLIKKLSQRAKDFIIASDFDVEGEVIGWNVLRFICNQKTAKRMKYSTLTAPELKKSYENPLPELAWGSAYAGETRHILDWLYGINLSRALMSAIKTAGSFKILSIGRVQGPALKIIVDREHEISKFKPEPFWRVFAETCGVKLQHERDIFKKSELEKFKNITEGVAETKKSEENISPPVPFDLTTLQRETYRIYGFSPSTTLKIAQQLYLDGIISYPRTSSQKIPDAIEPKKILKKLEKIFPEAKQANRIKPVEGKKTDPAHPSIYPTGEYKKLEDSFEKLYSLIAKRFISCFSADAKTANKKIVLLSIPEKLKFAASGAVVLEKGWTSFYPMKIEETLLPDLNGKVKVEKVHIEEKETQPPKRYTPASLVSILEKKNLGTKATRSMIVDTLFERGYLDGKSIQATPLGIRLIETLEKYSPIIIDERLTRKLEIEMEDIQKSKKDLEKKEKQIIEEAKEIINKISQEFKPREEEIGKEILQGISDLRQQQFENNTIMSCPVCKKGMLRIMYNKNSKRYFVACSAYPECRQTYPLPPNALIKKSDKVSDDGLPVLLAIKKGKRPWEFKFDPNWKANNPDYVSKKNVSKAETNEDRKI